MLADSYRAACQPVDQEICARLDVVEGNVPAGLRGVLFRNGPGRLERGGVRYGHLFDGDGMLCRFSFSSRGVEYRNRFVATREFEAERQADRILFRGFGTNLPGGLLPNLFRMRFKNAANTSVVAHGGRLLALWEGGLPHLIDPDTLATQERFSFGGRLLSSEPIPDRWVAPELPFSAHPRVDPATGEMINFGVLLGRRNLLLRYRISAAGRMEAIDRLVIERFPFIHDFVLTARHAVFFLPPFVFRMASSLLGLRSIADGVEQAHGRPASLLVWPRDGRPARWFDVRPGFIFHLAGGHDDGDRVVIDGFRLERYPQLRGFGVDPGEPSIPPILTRYTIDLGRGSVDERPLTEHPGELPGVSPLPGLGPRRFVWATGCRPGAPEPFFPAIWRLDTATGETTIRELGDDLPGEPVFVPRPGASAEDDGWLLSLVYRAARHRSELVVLDARSLETRCALALPHHVPPGFHGSWVSAPG